ncbi:MAG: tetratricopeptide repeat protein [Gammaproteobacteria bacterium]|nr:tetratricopeptide repeat protein [Gammaproteobacteria bacterium]
MRLDLHAWLILSGSLLTIACTPAPPVISLPGQPRLERLDTPVRIQFVHAYDRAEKEILAGVPADMAVAIGELGMLYHAYSYPEPALQAYLAARHLQRGETRWHYLYGLVADELGMTDDAESAFKEAHRIDSESGIIALRLGRIFLHRGQLPAALTWFERALADDLQTGPALEGLGMIDLERGDPQAAIVRLSRARELMPDEVAVLHALGNAYRARGQRQEALKLYEQARSAVSLPQREFANDSYMQEILLLQRGHKQFDRMAASALSRGQTDEALAHYRRALDAQPAALDVRHNLALLLWRSDRKEEARAEFEQIFSRRPAYAPSHMFLAFELGIAGELDAAEDHILIALESDPDNLDTQLLLADFLDFNERSDEALIAYEKAISLDPDMEKAWIGAVYSLIRLNRHADAVTMSGNGLMRLPESEQLANLHAQVRELNRHETDDQ